MKNYTMLSVIFAIHAFVAVSFSTVAHADSIKVTPIIKVTPYYFYIGDVRTEELMSLYGVADGARNVDWVVEASECAAIERVSRATSFAKKHAGKYKGVTIVKTKFECF
jgi:hypothetical protein